jgi:hypothetical protein
MKIKKLTLVLFALFSLNSYSHKDIIIKKQFGNVYVVFQTPYKYEEVNKGLIIGIYAEKMLKQINYLDSIILHFKHAQYPYVFSEDTININKLKLYKTTKNPATNIITFTMYDFNYNIKNVLNFVYNNLHNPNNEYQYNELLKIFNTPNKLTEKIIKEKTLRQYTYNEKNYCSYLKYYTKNNKYFIIRKNKIIDSLNDITQFGNICHLGYFMSINKTLSIYNSSKEKITKFKLHFQEDFIYPIKMIYISNNIYILKITTYFKNKLYLYLVNLENNTINEIFIKNNE